MNLNYGTLPRRSTATQRQRYLLAALTLSAASPAFTETPFADAGPSTAAAGSSLTAIGEAHDTQSGQLLYREYHYRQLGSGFGTVEYRDPEQRLLSTKSLDFNHAPWAPAFQQIDLRTGELIFARWQGETLTMGYRESQRDSLQKEQVNAEQLVADAGFDGFIRERWNDLVTSQPQRFEFAVPSRLNTLTLIAQRRDCETARQSQDAVCFRVKPDNWLFAMLVDPIDLRYDSNHRQLLRFRGLSNITDAEGKPQTVDIRYRHAEPGGYLAEDQVADRPQADLSS